MNRHAIEPASQRRKFDFLGDASIMDAASSGDVFSDGAHFSGSARPGAAR